MNLAAHLTSLESKKAILEKAITDESQRPVPDSIRITRLKREKLRLKEEIERYHQN